MILEFTKHMKKVPKYDVYFGNASNLEELEDGEISLVVTSPPYYNAPFDYEGLFKDYDEYLELLKNIAEQLKNKVAPGRIVAIVTDDMLVKGQKYPIVADTTRAFVNAGFRYRERITWLKPKGYVRISKRSGVLMVYPYPMYYYPDNIQESILIFQNGQYEYDDRKQMSKREQKKNRIDLTDYNKGDLYMNTWQITNVLPIKGRLEEGIAAFPDEIARRLILFYSHIGETVCDPFLGSGTTMKVAMNMDRNCIGYELDKNLKEIIKKKVNQANTKNHKIKFITRKDAKMMRNIVSTKN